jgi:hypothetical protein
VVIRFTKRTSKRRAMMGSKAKYASGITSEDFLLMVRAEELAHGVVIWIGVEVSVTQPTYWNVRVEVFEAATTWEGRKPLKVGQALARAKGDGYWSQLSHLVHCVMNDYANDPWNWTLVDRKREASLNTGDPLQA